MPPNVSVRSRKRRTATSSAAISAAVGTRTLATRFARDRERRKAPLVDGLEGQPVVIEEVEPRGRPGLAPRVGHGVLDGNSHVRESELRLEGAVDELDQGMDEALRMDEHIDLLVVQIVQPACLDHLQALVGERCRVDRDLGAHRPVGVSERLVRGRRRDAFRWPVAERTARRGEDHAPHGVESLADQALPQRRVLRVDRSQPEERRRAQRSSLRGAAAASVLGERHHQVPASDERLLVGGRDRLAGAQRGEDRSEADHASRSDHEQVDVVARGDPLERFVAVAAREDRLLRPEARRLLAQELLVAARRERDHLERACGFHHLERLSSDRPGRTQQRDADRRLVCPAVRFTSGQRRRRSAAGRAPGRAPVPRTGTSRSGRARRRGRGSGCPSPWRRRPA